MKKQSKQASRRSILEAKPLPAAEPETSHIGSRPFHEQLLEFAVSLANKLQACGAET